MMPQLRFRRPDRKADTSVGEMVRNVLRLSGHWDLQEIVVSESFGAVRLDGVVRSYYLKQQAQSLAMTVDGVIRVENEVVVA